MLKGLAAGAALVVAPPWLNGEAAPAAKRGFKIGAADWELTKANDPGALKAAAKLGFNSGAKSRETSRWALTRPTGGICTTCAKFSRTRRRRWTSKPMQTRSSLCRY
jgi:hypothetical protein